jgi:hypothetical protein
MNNMNSYVLFFARSYLNPLACKLKPYLDSHGIRTLFVTQTESERRKLCALGYETVPSIQEVLKRQRQPVQSRTRWVEPGDFREVTQFFNDPILSDRFLLSFEDSQRSAIANVISNYVDSLYREYDIVGFLSEPVTMLVTHLFVYWGMKNGAKNLLWCTGFYPRTMYFTSSLDLNPNPVLSAKCSDVGLGVQGIAKYIQDVRNNYIGPVYNRLYNRNKRVTILSLLKGRNGRSPLILDNSSAFLMYALARLIRTLYYRLFFRFTQDYITAGSVQECSVAVVASLLSYLPYRRSREFLRLLLEQGEVAGRKVFFYPVQYEPEASLTYVAPLIDSQQNLIRKIITILPSDAILVIKEHPNQLGSLKLPRWSFLSGLPNVVAVPGHVNARNIIKSSYAVLTISSTAGFEACLLGIPTIVFSKCYYSKLPFAVECLDYHSLSSQGMCALVHEVLVRALDDDQLVESIMDLSSCLSKGDPQPSGYLYDSDNLNHLAINISRALQA